MIVFLVGAKKNIGDFLIHDRAKKLFDHVLNEEIIALNRFNYLDEHIDILNRARYVVLCGGPAYAEDIFPGIYKLLKDPSKLKTPILPFGLGIYKPVESDYTKFKFTEHSKKMLDTIHSKIDNSSCRCVLTKEMMQKNGIDNVVMTGCPVWYHVESLGKKFEDKPIKKIVFTSPASPKLVNQATKLLKIVRNLYPDAKIYYTFHRGILPDKHTKKASLGYVLMSLRAKMLDWNIEVLDVSYDMDKIAFYKDCDLHVGYRVHAHLDFLSKRLPSVLINEDVRGLGMVKSMNLPELNIKDENLIPKFKKVMSDYKKENFKSLHRISEFIDNQYEIMKKFILNL